MGCVVAKADVPIEDNLTAEFVRACLLTQRWYRASKAKKERRRRAIWELLQYMEFNREQDQVELFNFYNSILKHLPQVYQPKNVSVVKDIIKYDIEIFEEPTFANYNGPIVNFPITLIEVQKLIAFFHRKSTPVLHPKYVCPILRLAAMHLKGLKNINVPSIKPDCHITICGDLHGSLTDLLVVFHKNGLPAKNNPYVFNGNFVDFGENGMEVLILLLACFLAFPNSVYFNRGNHEDMVMNKRHGFMAEVSKKYGRNAPNIVYLIESVYRWLPLGTVVYGRVLIVHGGLSIDTDWSRLQKLPRGEFVSILRPPFDKYFNTQDWRQSFDLLWSDPQDAEGCMPNTLRGGGMFFGPDITSKFLKKNKFTLLVRSHQCKADGFELTHNNKLVTVFTHANYFALGSNKGAYLRLYDDVRLHFVRYVTSSSRIQEMKEGETLIALEKAAILNVGVRLQKKMNKLRHEFKKVDAEGTGYISITKWCDVMLHVTQMKAPWYSLVDRFGQRRLTTNRHIQINYNSTLELLNSEQVKLEYQKINFNVETLTEDEENLAIIFQLIDQDNSGTITAEEFILAWELIESYMSSERKRGDLLKWFALMDYNKDGEINFDEFLEAFRWSTEYRTSLVQPTAKSEKQIRPVEVFDVQENLSEELSSEYSISAASIEERSEYTLDEHGVDTDIDIDTDTDIDKNKVQDNKKK